MFSTRGISKRLFLLSKNFSRIRLPSTCYPLTLFRAVHSSPTVVGQPENNPFQTETTKLLNIIANSLYSDKEVFLRELISNSSDALEKLRFMSSSGEEMTNPELPLQINIFCDPEKKTLSIQDSGIGMTKDELMKNLGVIAKSGSQEFAQKLDSFSSEKLIGQFGVGFYSSFITGSRVSVFSRSYKPGSVAYCWQSDGTGEFTLAEAEGVDRGTLVNIQLRDTALEFSKPEKIIEIVKKYCNFFTFPIYVNDKRLDLIEPIWLADPKKVSVDDHAKFFRYISGGTSESLGPRFTYQFRTEAPTCMSAVLYVPKYKPTLVDLARDGDVTVSLYCRKVMIMEKAKNILPRWLRFLKGVVNCEDIPLNISREMLQDHVLISKIKSTLAMKIVKFLQNKSKEEPEDYLQFFSDFGMFIREGLVLSSDQTEREEIAKLIRFESSKLPAGQKTSLEEYRNRMTGGSRNIYYFLAPNRTVAESSPYMEAMRRKDSEVLLCTEQHDELVLMNLAQFDTCTLKSVESIVDEDNFDGKHVETADGSRLTNEESNSLTTWMKKSLGNKVRDVRTTNVLESHPAVLSVKDLGAIRHFLKTSLTEKDIVLKQQLTQGVLEINPKHPIMMSLHRLRDKDETLSVMLLNQLYDNAVANAGLCDDPKLMVSQINELLSKLLEKY